MPNSVFLLVTKNLTNSKNIDKAKNKEVLEKLSKKMNDINQAEVVLKRKQEANY